MSTAVLVVAHTATLGGAELGLLRYLASDPPFELRVLVLEDGPLVERLRELGADVVVPERPGTAAALRTLASEVRRRRPVVLSWTLRAALLVGLVTPRRRHLFYLQDLLRGGYFGRVKVLLADGLIVRRPGAIMVNSEATRRSLPRETRVLARWVVHTPSGVSASAVAETPPGDQPLDVLRPLFLGRIAPWKGPDLLLDACEEVARCDAGALDGVLLAGGSFFGEEEYRAEVEARAAAAGTPVEVLDHQDDIDALFARANVLVHTSRTPEPFGQVIAQAMARGVLVVAPDDGGPSELITDGESGFLYERGNAVALADVLLAIRRDPRRAEAVARQGRVAVAAFSDERVCARITDALTDFAPAARRDLSFVPARRELEVGPA